MISGFNVKLGSTVFEIINIVQIVIAVISHCNELLPLSFGVVDFNFLLDWTVTILAFLILDL
jgi:hypothetical protein